MAAMTSFYVEKCCHLVSDMQLPSVPLPVQFLIYSAFELVL